MSHSKKSATVAIGAALASGLALSGSAFAMQPLAQGYMLATASVAADKAPEGKCGEGKCGGPKMDTDKDGRVSRAEFAASHDNDDSKFAIHDLNGDGFISADEMKAKEGKCGEGKKAGDNKAAGEKAAMEGKCGEGKCGSN